jgi:hypothetical protein
MRLKVIIPILLITVATLAMIQLIRPDPGRGTILQDSANSIAIPTTNAVTEATSDSAGVDAQEPLQTRQARSSAGEESHEEYISRRTAELMDLAMSDDPASLQSILSELNNPEAEIRDAAVMAAVQFKTAEAIPALQDAYTRTDEPEEKISIRKAIEFLEPTPAAESATGSR